MLSSFIKTKGDYDRNAFDFSQHVCLTYNCDKYLYTYICLIINKGLFMIKQFDERFIIICFDMHNCECTILYVYM